MTPEERIVAVLTEFGPMPAREVIRILRGRAEQSVTAAVAEMIREGRVGLDDLRRLVLVTR